MKFLPKNWILIPLGDCCQIISGSTPKRNKPEYWGGDIPWVTPKDLGKLKTPVLKDAPEKITEAGYKSCSTTLLPQGSILFSSRAPIGYVAIAGRPMCTNQGFKSLVPNEYVHSPYLYWCMRKYASDIEALGSGTTFKEVSKGIVERFIIPLPPLEEQRRIAAILDKADGVRRKRKEAIRLTEELLKSTFLEMFGDPVTNPKGWEVESLGDLVEFRTGKLDSNAAVENGRYPFFTCSRVPFSIDEYAFDCEALLLAGNNASADYWVKHYKGKFNAYQRTYILNLKNERISYFYMQKALDLRLNELKQSSRGTNTKYLTLTILKPIKIQLPNIEVQDKYEAFCRSQETQRGRLTQAFEQSENLFNSLLQRAFRGEL